MDAARHVHWQDGGMWVGYFEEFPDYPAQAEGLAELEENLPDLYRDLTSGEIPGIRRIAELVFGGRHWGDTYTSLDGMESRMHLIPGTSCSYPFWVAMARAWSPSRRASFLRSGIPLSTSA